MQHYAHRLFAAFDRVAGGRLQFTLFDFVHRTFNRRLMCLSLSVALFFLLQMRMQAHAAGRFYSPFAILRIVATILSNENGFAKNAGGGFKPRSRCVSWAA